MSDSEARDDAEQPGAAPILGSDVTTSPMATLEQLLEVATRAQAARFGSGTLVGECLDTHNPHLPRRVFVRARDEDGQQVTAWLPVLDQLRIRPGDKLLLSKPDNWPEPVVLGVLAGLERPVDANAADAASQTAAAATGDPHLRLEPGQSVVITNPEGQPMLSLRATAQGPQVELLAANVSFDMPGCVRIGAERIELHSREGGVDIRSDGDTIVRSRVIRLN
jgi:hypothetical protein